MVVHHREGDFGEENALGHVHAGSGIGSHP